ncbi:MAG: glycosyl hydrolase 53 family protein, partial [Oscillospiraceae bacterium]|nr:glycosyl hydrolase 53 family protein [Oscillospiraceae bacterium]
GAGQDLAIDFHYADSWSDPQNQPKPYAWANLPFESEDADTKDLIDTTYDFTYEMIKALIDQGTAPTIVALGNEVTNGMMWGSEYGLVNPFADFHDYYKRFVRGNPDAPLGGGVEWINYEDSEGDTESAEYKSFEASITRLAKLVDAGQRAIRKLNEEYGLNIKTEMHFAFNVFERTSDGKIAMDPDFVSKKVLTLVGGLNDNLSTMSGMTDRIGVSYYPDWHGSYDQVQRNIVELSRMLPGVEFNIAECSPPSSGTVADYMDNPNHEVGFEYSVQSQGDDTIEILKLINDVPNNVGQGVWPWNGQAVYFGGGWYQNAEGTWSQSPPTTLASLKAFKDAFATGVIESTVYVTTKKGVAPTLPETVKELTVSDKSVSAVTVTWDVPQDASYDELGVFEIFGTAAAKGNMVDVVAIVTVVE